MSDKAAEIKNLVEAWVFRLNGAVSELREMGVVLDLSVSGNVLTAKIGEVVNAEFLEIIERAREAQKEAKPVEAKEAPAPDMKAKPKANG